jgi:DNA-binding MarR family transcriptional regulator
MKLVEIIMNDKYQGLDGPAKLIFLTLRMRANEETLECWPSVTKIADDCSLSRPTVIKYLKKLNIIGLIKKSKAKGVSRGKNTLYKINIGGGEFSGN